MSHRFREMWALTILVAIALVGPATAAVAQAVDLAPGLVLSEGMRAGRSEVQGISGTGPSDADGVTLRPGGSNELPVTVIDPSSVASRLQAGNSVGIIEVDPPWQRFLNRCVSGLEVGLLIALAAVGLSLIFGVSGLVNFAHSELVAFGAVVALSIESGTGLPFLIAVVLAVGSGGALGLGLEFGLFAPLRRRKMSNISMMVVSIGLAFVMRYLILIYFGSGQESFEAYRIQDNFDIGPVSLPPKDYYIMAAAFLVLIAVAFLLQKTKLGTAMRAVSDNPLLARSSGIDVDRTIKSAWVFGSALAALGGILFGLTEVVEWQMGERILLLAFAAVTLGGLGTAHGAMLGGLAVGFASEVSTFWIADDFKYFVALVLLIVSLAFRPQGPLGHGERFG